MVSLHVYFPSKQNWLGSCLMLKIWHATQNAHDEIGEGSEKCQFGATVPTTGLIQKRSKSVNHSHATLCESNYTKN